MGTCYLKQINMLCYVMLCCYVVVVVVVVGVLVVIRFSIPTALSFLNRSL